MARVKKRGLDYFPMNTDFIHGRIVRRIMKHEGDAAVAVLLEALSYIYAGEGYYVLADRLFYEDLSASLYEKSTESVTRIIHLAVEYGLFDSGLFAARAVLSSAEIQRQYLFSTKRRSVSQLEPAYCLLTDNELAVTQPKKGSKGSRNAEDEPTGKCVFEDENVTFIPENVTSGTHSIAQNSIAQQSIAENSTAEHSVAENRKEHPLQYVPVGMTDGERESETGKEEGNGKREEEKEEEISLKKGEIGRPRRREEWTVETIDALQPPEDGLVRNYEGLIYNMRLYTISPPEQYAIIKKSNFGAIGGPVWKGFCSLRESNGRIKLPGRYLLSVINK